MANVEPHARIKDNQRSAGRTKIANLFAPLRIATLPKLENKLQNPPQKVKETPFISARKEC